MTARPNLREAQKAFTRVRIREAARDLFHAHGYHGTTLDQIAAAAGASRQTVYLHFESKDAVLRDVVEDYVPRLVQQIETCPGPLPTLPEVTAWVHEWAAFIRREKPLISLLGQIASTAPAQPAFATMTASIETFARRLPAFAAVHGKGPVGLEARARAELLIVELTFAGQVALTEDGTAYAEASLAVVAGLLHAFAHDPRFARIE